MNDKKDHLSADSQAQHVDTQTQHQESQSIQSNSGNLAHDSSVLTQPIVIEQKGGKGWAVGALVLSILALGASGFLFVQGQNVLKTQSLQINQQLDKAALGNSENGVLLKNSLSKQEALAEQVIALNKAQEDTQQRLENIQAAYAELLKGRTNWLVDEIEVTLNIASQQLLLSGNVPVAIGVLESIEQRLNRFEQTELLPIKQAISQDLADLKNRPYLNIPATTLRIDRLQSAVAVLPLSVDDTLQAQNQYAESTSQTSGFWQKTWDYTANMLKGMVEVRRLDNGDPMLMAPEQIYFVRENIRLRLLDARLALLQHNAEVYQNDLNAIEATVKQYFDMQAAPTQEWLKELAELKSLEVRMVSDGALHNSLTAVRAYQNNVATTLPITLPENALALSSSTVASSPENTASEPTASEEVASSANHVASQPTVNHAEGK